ncbi:hypothetical protein C2E23DRAFT_553923 [Lenzites betulinus]|nr:hypothetical protein C2E23DRAFT_553923 [Lenzites betulinus]
MSGKGVRRQTWPKVRVVPTPVKCIALQRSRIREIAKHTQCGVVHDNNDGPICGVLNDQDIAGDAPRRVPQTHAGFEVTGMAPFMAIDLLTDAAYCSEVHHCLYRHDLESLFWILIWVVSCIEDGKQIDPLPEMYQEWTSGRMRTCCNSKRRFLSIGWKYSGGGPRPTWSAEGKLAHNVLYYFAKTQIARDMQRFHVDDAAPVEEVDEPEKVWDEFCAVIREVGRAHLSLGYLVDFS